MATDPDCTCDGVDAGQYIGLSIPSRMELLAVLDGLVTAIAGQMSFDEEATIELATSVIEAGTNAIQHGHQHDQSKTVVFRFYLGDEALDVWVADHGPGFDVASVLNSDPTRPEDLLKSRGRGIFIMRAMMDLVEFEVVPGRGTVVHLVKNRRGGNGSRP